jgi:hypothetical protein
MLVDVRDKRGTGPLSEQIAFIERVPFKLDGGRAAIDFAASLLITLILFATGSKVKRVLVLCKYIYIDGS